MRTVSVEGGRRGRRGEEKDGGESINRERRKEGERGGRKKVGSIKTHQI